MPLANSVNPDQTPYYDAFMVFQVKMGLEGRLLKKKSMHLNLLNIIQIIDRNLSINPDTFKF